MIELKNPCTSSGNRKASTAARGGTPGQTNSVNNTNGDTTPPALERVHVLNDTPLIVTFDEPVDSAGAVALAHYSFTPFLTLKGATALNPLLQQVQLQLTAPLDVNTVYTLTVQHIADCSGNSIGSQNKLPVGQPKAAEASDVVINGILFNPRPNGYDYVELYNHSTKVIDAGQLYLANRDSTGSIASLKKLSETPYYLFQGDYVVLTDNASSLHLQYFVQNPHAVLPLSSLPFLSDREGKVVLLSLQGDVVDELHYQHDWHFALP